MLENNLILPYFLLTYIFVISINLLISHLYKDEGSAVNILELAGEDQRQDSHQLNQNVECGARSVLEGVSNCVPHNGCLMNVSSLGDLVALVINHCATLDVFLGVVPSSTGVGS